MFKRTLFPHIFMLMVVLTLLLTPLMAFSAKQAKAQSSPENPSGWQLVWSDEFNGPDGSAIDTSRWNFETGGSWGNGTELQYYTDRTVNAHQQGGNLEIVARRENYGGNQYTSARLTTQNKADWKYGRFEIRAKLPYGQGIWPAIWLMPTNSVYGGWPKSGEIDIMELIGNNMNKVYGTLHWADSSGADTSSQGTYSLPNGGSYADAFHIFTLEWDAAQLRLYMDGNLYHTLNKSAPFDQLFYVILNIAVGGNWPGPPNSSTVFPQTMYVDYVRAYQWTNTTNTPTAPPPTATRTPTNPPPTATRTPTSRPPTATRTSTNPPPTATRTPTNPPEDTATNTPTNPPPTTTNPPAPTSTWHPTRTPTAGATQTATVWATEPASPTPTTGSTPGPFITPGAPPRGPYNVFLPLLTKTY